MANLEKAVATGTWNPGTVALSRVGALNDEFQADFLSYPLSSLLRSYGGSFGSSIGSCTAYSLLASALVLTDPIQPPRLDAGLDASRSRGLTNLPSVINRAQNLTVTWSNGASFPLVTIFGFSGVPYDSTQNSYVEFHLHCRRISGTIHDSVGDSQPASHQRLWNGWRTGNRNADLAGGGGPL